MRTAFALLVFCGLSAALVVPAAAADVSLDNVTVKEKDASILFPHIAVVDTNLTSDEVSRVFSNTGDKAERKALVAKMKAASISIPETRVTMKTGSLTFHNFVAKNVNSGTVGEMSLAGADGAFDGPQQRPVTIKAGAALMQGMDFSKVIAAETAASLPGGPFHNAHFSWSGFQATVPDKDTPADAAGGNLWRISLGTVEGNGSYQGAVPLKSSGDLKDLVIEPPAASHAGDVLRAFGYKQIHLGMTASGTYNPAKQAYTLDDYTWTGSDAGQIGFKALVNSIASLAFSATSQAGKAAIANGELQSFEVRIVNAGLFEKTLAWYAAQRGQPADLLRRQWAAAATLLIPLMLKGDPDGPQLAAAVTDFINKPKTLTLTVKVKDEGLKLGDIQALFLNKSLLPRIDMQAVAAP